MAYNNWKLMEKLDVAVRAGEPNYSGFTGYVVEHGDENALKSATDWATITPYNREKGGYQTPIKPKVYTFDNEGFTATILNSAGGSSQGGRLSFWQCKVEKDGVEFVIGVNDAILADLIRNSDIEKGKVKQKLMFARKGGQPGFIHENMEAYADATADMKKKADLKSAKKTKKWEIGGVYSSLTQTDICLGEVYDTMEEYEVTSHTGYWGRAHTETKLRKAKTPVKVLAWKRFYNFSGDKEVPSTLEEILKEELKDKQYIYFSAGTPPARAKASQLEVKETDNALLNKMFSLKEDQIGYGEPKIKGRYVREIK